MRLAMVTMVAGLAFWTWMAGLAGQEVAGLLDRADAQIEAALASR